MTRHARSLRLVLLATVVLPLFNGCAVYRELQPAVRFDPMSAGEYIAMQRGDILTTGRLVCSGQISTVESDTPLRGPDRCVQFGNGWGVRARL